MFATHPHIPLLVDEIFRDNRDVGMRIAYGMQLKGYQAVSLLVVVAIGAFLRHQPDGVMAVFQPEGIFAAGDLKMVFGLLGLQPTGGQVLGMEHHDAATMVEGP